MRRRSEKRSPVFNDAASLDPSFPLHDALLRLDEEAVLSLLETDAAKDIDRLDSEGHSPLMRAVQSGKTNIVRKMLEKGGNPDARYAGGAFSESLLEMAAGAGNADMIRVLIEAGADLQRAQRSKGTATSLFLAVNGMHYTATKILLEHGMNPNAAADFGISPLMAATRSGNEEMIDLLIAFGADGKIVSEGLGNALHFLSSHADKKTVKKILGAGAGINETDAEKKTPLFNAISRRHHRTALALLEEGADVNILTRTDASPLHIAVFTRDFVLLKEILKRNPPLNMIEKTSQMTALHLACLYNLSPFVEALLKAGASPDTRDAFGNTPLHTLLKTASVPVELAKLFLDKGANVLALNKAGATPYDVAFSEQRTSVLPLFDYHLRQKGVRYTPKRFHTQSVWPRGFF